MKTTGQEAYEAYAAVTDGRNFTGGEMPMFWMLPEKIQAAWEAAAKHAFSKGVKHASARHRRLLDQIEKEFWG